MNAEIADLTRQLRMLGNQAMRLAADVAARQAQEAERSVFEALERDSDIWLVVAQDLYRERQRRREIFGDDLFGEPAWDLLLDLYIAEKTGTRTSVTAACLGANVPGTTALRYLQQLEERGLVLREGDRRDARRVFVRLSEAGYARMTDYFWANRATLLRDRAAPPPPAAAPSLTARLIEPAAPAAHPLPAPRAAAARPARRRRAA